MSDEHTLSGQPCPNCGHTIATWFLDCPCGDETTTACAACDLKPAQDGWAHVAHLSPDLFEAVGL